MKILNKNTANQTSYMKKIYLFVLTFSFVASANAQDIHFSQQTETPLYISPANAGFFNGYVRAIGNYRSQWAAMNKAFQTQAISVDGGLFRLKKRAAFMGMGLTFFNDQAGAAKMRKTNLMLNVSGVVKLGAKSAMSAGVALGTAATNANYASLTYASQFNGNQLDPAIINGEIPYRQFTTMDVGAGLAYEYATYKRDQDHDDVTSFKIALGAYHLNRPVQEYGAGSAYRLPIRYAANFSSVFDIEDERFTIAPNILFQMQGKTQEFYLGSYVKYRMSTGTKVTGAKTQNALGFGLFYRNKDAIIPALIFDIGDFTVAMSYDVNVSGYRTASNKNGGFEIALRYNMLASSLFDTKREYR
ncbi:MAG: PorP/SprF family type IX secretion system membrane protein [Bacteroidetes bacterium]|nr:PorP/SprF family type IX secretion system membrane protein [Bacteroidota bacterium]